MNEVFNHLWQSTVFAAAVAVVTLALRRNSPRLRYWLWLGASIKFLIPFSLLVSTGALIQFPPDTPSLHAVTVQQISSYFAPVSLVPTAGPAAATFRLPRTLGAIWLAGMLFLLVRWFRRWRAIHLAARQATRLPAQHALSALSSPAMVEPGVFGLFRPVLLLPEGITDNLTPEQFDAILDHELRHVCYRDNLTAALHMCVETLFWFHPVVWWIGAKLMDERERDCDEAVLRQGSQPADYARGIVQVCEAYIESPPACASGISGSDLKKRIRQIMNWRGSLPVTFRGKAMLALAAMTSISLPFVIGVIRAQTLPPPPTYNYDVVEIHRAGPAEIGSSFNRGPQGGLRTQNTRVIELLDFAFDVSDYRFTGAAGWVASDRYDVTLTPDRAEAAPGLDPSGWISRSRQRLQAVLRDRFGLVLRAATRELPEYSLVQARSGAKISRSEAGGGRGFFHNNGKGHVESADEPIKLLTDFLASSLGRPVIDETGLNGEYDYKLDWNPEVDPGEPGPDGPGNPATGASIFTALTDQLGLRLESTKGPVQVYVIEKIERPTEN